MWNTANHYELNTIENSSLYLDKPLEKFMLSLMSTLEGPIRSIAYAARMQP